MPVTEAIAQGFVMLRQCMSDDDLFSSSIVVTYIKYKNTMSFLPMSAWTPGINQGCFWSINSLFLNHSLCCCLSNVKSVVYIKLKLEILFNEH